MQTNEELVLVRAYVRSFKADVRLRALATWYLRDMAGNDWPAGRYRQTLVNTARREPFEHGCECNSIDIKPKAFTSWRA